MNLIELRHLFREEPVDGLRSSSATDLPSRHEVLMDLCARCGVGVPALDVIRTAEPQIMVGTWIQTRHDSCGPQEEIVRRPVCARGLRIRACSNLLASSVAETGTLAQGLCCREQQPSKPRHVVRGCFGLSGWIGSSADFAFCKDMSNAEKT